MKNKKTWIWLSIIIILFLSFVSGAAYVAYKTLNPVTTLKRADEKKDDDISKDVTKPTDSDDIFPKWESDSFDKFTKYENNQVVFDKELVSYFITQTIKRLGTSRGKIEYSYEFNSDLKGVKIFVKWTYQKKVQRKKYTIFIDSL